MDKLIKFESWEVTWGVMLGAIFSFLSPVAPFIALAVVLICADWWSGVKAAKKNKEAINSDGFARTLEKFALYTTMIFSSEGIRLVFFEGFKNSLVPVIAEFPITYIVSFAICMREFKSLSENAYVLTGLDIWSIVADKIENVFSLFKKQKDKDNEP